MVKSFPLKNRNLRTEHRWYSHTEHMKERCVATGRMGKLMYNRKTYIKLIIARPREQVAKDTDDIFYSVLFNNAVNCQDYVVSVIEE
jgi:hypothetical protein